MRNKCKKRIHTEIILWDFFYSTLWPLCRFTAKSQSCIPESPPDFMSLESGVFKSFITSLFRCLSKSRDPVFSFHCSISQGLMGPPDVTLPHGPPDTPACPYLQALLADTHRCTRCILLTFLQVLDLERSDNNTSSHIFLLQLKSFRVFPSLMTSQTLSSLKET